MASGCGPPVADREYVLDVDHPDHFVEAAAIDRQAAMARFGEQGDEIGEAGLFLDRDDVRARHADIARVAFAEMEQVADHLALELRQVADGIGSRIVFMAFDHVLELIAQRRFVFSEQRLQLAPDTVAGVGTGALGHCSRSVLFDQIGVVDAERGERIGFDRFHRFGLAVGHVVIT